MPPPYKKATCRGSYALGSACGHCERCDDERVRMGQPVQTPDKYYAKRFSQADIDRAVKAERDRLENILKDLASRAHAALKH